jgi:membrane-bound serine protease (ClpP class)
MAPGTNIGAAHPVIFGKEGYQPLPKDDIMMEKATNDTVAWVRSICDVRKRNSEVAEKAVSESKSLSAKDAVDQKLVDGMADSLDDVLDKSLPQRTVTLKDGSTLSFAGLKLEPKRIEMTMPQRVHHLINNPTFIYVLLLIGMLGVAIEFKSPGLVFPAMIGAACIIFALIAPSLPINYIGLVLIVIGVALVVAEVFITSFGLLTLAGLAALVFGSLMLFKAPEVPDMDPFMVPHVTPPLPLMIGTVIFVASIILIFGTAIVRAHRQKVMTGSEEMVGAETQAATDIGPQGGKIFIRGEWWNAFSDVPIAKGDRIVIKSVDNLVCRVEKAGGEKPPASPSS